MGVSIRVIESKHVKALVNWHTSIFFSCNTPYSITKQ